MPPEISPAVRATIEADALRQRRRRRIRFALLGGLALVIAGMLGYWQITAATCDGDVQHRTARVCYPNPDGLPEDRDDVGLVHLGRGFDGVTEDSEYITSSGPFRLAGGDLAAIATERSTCRGPASAATVDRHPAAVVTCEGREYQRLIVVDVGEGEYAVVEGRVGPGGDHAAVDAILARITVFD
ncbi:hypothetical protein Afil01_46900 [Actinorhabdospora filicis]|uniref:Uncharacterized protein n=1 Tax=Actinorhabdospora filicis TaxID=1785913 RepID=A0A9W6WBA7_9ACTN|nr:hypothetical protein [Actinorhabdospora filicis]GLZ79883.1 hypothetical protein Afil01_46900 [Actinorhabdospora filicis]